MVCTYNQQKGTLQCSYIKKGTYNQAHPPRRMTRSMPQDTGLGQDSPVTASEPSLPQRITRSRAQALDV